MSRYPLRGALAIVAAALLAAVPTTGASQDVKIDKATKKAIDKALEWIARQQNSDGSWGEGRYPHNTAVTSFALLAYLSQGHLPGQGHYGPEVAKGTRFLMAAQREDGYLVGARGGNMYCHGMATLALGQLWGQTGDDEIKTVLEKAVDLIVRCQDKGGGWRYEPRPSGADISVTIMQVMALRSAKNGGVHVPEATLKHAIEYIRKCHDKNSGGFTYQPGNRQPGFARTAAGVCVLYLTGEYDADEIARATKYLEENTFDRKHFWYGHYYGSHAMCQVGGKKWEEWYAKIRERLLSKQETDGSWRRGLGSDENVGVTYQTAIAVIILSVPANYLPIFQS